MKLNISESEKAVLYKNVLAGKFPDELGRFGPFGGRYIPETLLPAFSRLEVGVKKYLSEIKRLSLLIGLEPPRLH